MRGAGGRERNVGGTDGVIEESGIDTTRPNRVKNVGADAAVRVLEIPDQVGHRVLTRKGNLNKEVCSGKDGDGGEGVPIPKGFKDCQVTRGVTRVDFRPLTPDSDNRGRSRGGGEIFKRSRIDVIETEYLCQLFRKISGRSDGEG